MIKIKIFTDKYEGQLENEVNKFIKEKNNNYSLFKIKDIKYQTTATYNSVNHSICIVYEE